MEIGICVEGQNDAGAIEDLLARISLACKPGQKCEFITRIHRGYADVVRNLHQDLAEFNSLGINLAVIFADNDREHRNKRLRELEDICNRTGCRYDYIVSVAVEAFEAWLLADETALSAIASKVIKTTKSPEGIRRPDIHLRKIMERHKLGIPYNDILRKIANQMDMGVVTKRCRSFNEFHKQYVAKI